MKVNIVKKVTTVIVATAMALALFTVPVSVSAHEETETESTVMPRSLLCPHCGGTMNVVSTSWGAWYRTGVERSCNTYAWGTDLELKRTGTRTYTCSTCGFGKSESVSETKWECHGYN